MAELETLQTTVTSDPAIAPEPATTTVPTSAFKTFQTQADYDREIQKAIKANEENAAKKAAKALEEKSLTESQKIQKQIDELNAKTELVNKKYSEVAAREVLSGLGLEREQYEVFLDGIVTTDSEETKERAKSLGAHILTVAETLAQKKIQSAMKTTPVPTGIPIDPAQKPTPESEYNELYKQAQKNPNDRALMQRLFVAKERLKK